MSTSSKIITNRKIKIALVGCGRISNNHFAAISQLNSDLELVGICDTDKKTLDQACTQYQVPAYDDFSALLSNSNADIISICTPSGLHPEHTIAAAQFGKHVIK